MPPPLDEPLRKVTMNFFAADVLWLERRYGRGWTEVIRDLVRKHRKEKDRVDRRDV